MSGSKNRFRINGCKKRCSHTLPLNGEHAIKPYEDSNTLIEQSDSLNYSYIIHRLTWKTPLWIPWLDGATNLEIKSFTRSVRLVVLHRPPQFQE